MKRLLALILVAGCQTTSPDPTPFTALVHFTTPEIIRAEASKRGIPGGPKAFTVMDSKLPEMWVPLRGMGHRVLSTWAHEAQHAEDAVAGRGNFHHDFRK